MKIKVSKSSLSGEIICPASKSYTHRAIAISSLCSGRSKIKNILFSRDTIATLKCCIMLGTKVSIANKDDLFKNFSDKTLNISDIDALSVIPRNSDRRTNVHNEIEFIVEGIGGNSGFNTPADVLPADNSGTTIRLLTSMCSLVTQGYSVLSGDDSLRKRPMGDLINALSQLGVNCFSTNPNYLPPIIVKGGGIRGGIAKISGKISSQFLSSLLLSGVFSKQGIILEVLGPQVSKPYIDSTLHIMRQFGIKIQNEAESSLVPGILHQEIQAENDNPELQVSAKYSIHKDLAYKPTIFRIPGDFSTAALLFSSAFLTESALTIRNLDFNTPQGDMQIIDIIKEMGGKIDEDAASGVAKIEGASELEGRLFDLNKTPDLLPVIAVLSLKAKGNTTITGISHARYKETDRVSNIASQLIKFGAQVVEHPDSIEIKPPIQIKDASIQSFNDHRLSMAFAIAGLATNSSVIDGAGSVDVSYPGFVSDMRNVGARMEYIENNTLDKPN